MASPQEVLEAVIPHPSDSTPQSRTAAAHQVMKGLQINGYAFVRRTRPMDPRQSGECHACGCDAVYIEQGPVFSEAMQRVGVLAQQLDHIKAVGRDMAAFIRAIGSGEIASLEEAQRIAKHGMGVEEMDGGIKLPTPQDLARPPPPTDRQGAVQTYADFQSPQQKGSVFVSDAPPPLS